MIKKFTIVAFFAALLITVSCNETTTANQSQATTPSVQPKIVYVNTDSIVKAYKMYQDLNKEFVVKAEKSQKGLEKKGTAFQTKLKSFENKIKNGLVTREEAMKMEQQLQAEQQEIMQFRDQEVAKLGEEEQVMINKIRFNVSEFIEKYNKEAKYDLILSTATGSNTVMASNPGFDITNDIITGLNAEYTPAKK